MTGGPVPAQREVDELCIAAGLGGEAAVVRFLDQYPDAIDQRSVFGDTALTWAATQGRKEIVELLLARGAAVDARKRDDWTALMEAAFAGHTEIVALLLKNGAAIDAVSNSGWTSLMRAAWCGHVEVTAVLLENGASLDIANGGTTALMYAQKRGYTRTVELLEQGLEKQRQRLADQREREAAQVAEIQSAARLEKLKQARPSKPVLKRNTPPHM